MDKLDMVKQVEIKKLSDKLLVSKVTQAGYPQEDIEVIDRQGMLEKWAEVAYAGKEGSIKPIATPLGYDIEFEKMKFEFQMKQWEAQRESEEKRLVTGVAERQAQREIEERKIVIEEERWKDQVKWQNQQLALMDEKKER